MFNNQLSEKSKQANKILGRSVVVPISLVSLLPLWPVSSHPCDIAERGVGKEMYTDHTQSLSQARAPFFGPHLPSDVFP